jgi:hypothetical protein
MNPLKRLALFATLFAVATPIARAGVPPEPVTVEPVVLLKDSQLEGCGLKASYQTGPNRVEFSVVAMRDDTATRFILEARWRNLKQAQHAPDTLVFKTGTGETSADFPKASPVAPQMLRTSARLSGIEGARFIQGVMVSGGMIDLRSTSGQTLALDLPGPMPQLVRASYLNCAGDLFRPQGETRRAWKKAADPPPQQ